VRNVQCGCGHYNSISHKDASSQPIHHPPMQTCTHTCRKNSLLTLHMCNTWTPNAAPRINPVHMDSLIQKPQPQSCVPTCRTQGPKPAERSDPKRLSGRCKTYMHALTHTARLTPYAIVNVKRKTDNVAILEMRMHCTSDNPGARANATRRWQGLAKPSGSLPILNGRYVSHRDNLREISRTRKVDIDSGPLWYCRGGLVCGASVDPYTNDPRVMLLAYTPIRPYECADLLSYLYQEMINESLGPFQLACAIVE
jgi:hypothetical protein